MGFFVLYSELKRIALYMFSMWIEKLCICKVNFLVGGRNLLLQE